MEVTLDLIKRARIALQEITYYTALVPNEALKVLSGNHIYLKMENLQRTGSFKVRGAFNKMTCLSPKDRGLGVVAASAGNHAQGVALAASHLRINANIVMPKHAPLFKISGTRRYGGEVILHGGSYDEAFEKAVEIKEKSGATFIHAFDDPLVIAGQGTVALEILEQLPETQVIIVPVGGGGLISGIAAAVKAMRPEIQVIGVQSANMASMVKAIQLGKQANMDCVATIADGIAVKTPGELTFELINKYVDQMVTVTEDQIADAILLLLEQAKITAEGAGAVSVAALLKGSLGIFGKNVVAVVSGGNIDVNILSRIIDKGLVNSGRKVFLTTIVPDKPGTLWRLLELIADVGANVLAVSHSRTDHDVPVGFAKVELELETNDRQHVAEIKTALKKYEYCITFGDSP